MFITCHHFNFFMYFILLQLKLTNNKVISSKIFTELGKKSYKAHYRFSKRLYLQAVIFE